MGTSLWGEGGPYSLVDDTNGVKRNISLMVLEMGIFLTTISNKPMSTVNNASFIIFVLFKQNENLIKKKYLCIYSLFWARPNLAITLIETWLSLLADEYFKFFKGNNLLCLFSKRNIGHRLKQSRPPASITIFLSKMGMVYFTSRLTLNEQNKERDKLGWFLPVLGPDCQRWCWIETKLLPVTHGKKHTHTN